MRLLCGSINVRETPWASKRQPIDYKRCCTDRLNAQTDTGHIRSDRAIHAEYLDSAFVGHPAAASVEDAPGSSECAQFSSRRARIIGAFSSGASPITQRSREADIEV